MQLDKNINEFRDEFERDGKSNRPPCKGYEMVILSAKDTKSHAGNPMLVLELDITKGEYAGFFSKRPLILYLAYHTDQLKGRLHGVLKTIIADNPGMFAADVLNNTKFDESKLCGLICGGVLKYNDKGYLDVSYITTIDRALQSKVVDKPATKTVNTSDDSLFD